MPHDRIRANHDELTQIAAFFAEESSAVAQTIRNLRQRKDVLQGGDWVGQAARRFFEEMDGDVLPTLLRLQRALSQSQSVTRTIAARLRQCEADAARQLQDREAFTGQPVGGSGGSLPSTGGDFTGQPVGGSGGSLPPTGGDLTGQPVGGSGGSLPSTGGDFTGQPVGGPGGSLPPTGGDFTGQPVGGSGGSLPPTGGDFTGQPVGGSGGSLPQTETGYSIGGATEFGPYSVAGSIDVLGAEISDTGRFGKTAEGQLAGSTVDLTFDPFGGPTQMSISGEGVLLGGQAAFGWGDSVKGGTLSGTGGAYSAEASLLGGWVKPNAAFELLSGNVFVGQQEGNYGSGGSLNSGSAEFGLVIGGPNLGLTFGAAAGGPSADLQFGLMDGNGAAGGGGRLGSLSGDVGLNVLGWNIGLGGGVEAGGSFGFQLGEHTEVKIGPLAGSLLIGHAR